MIQLSQTRKGPLRTSRGCSSSTSSRRSRITSGSRFAAGSSASEPSPSRTRSTCCRTARTRARISSGSCGRSWQTGGKQPSAGPTCWPEPPMSISSRRSAASGTWSMPKSPVRPHAAGHPSGSAAGWRQ